MKAADFKSTGQQTRPRSHPFRLARHRNSAKQHPIGPITAIGHHIHAVVNAIAHIDIKTPWLTKERFVAWGAAAKTVAGGGVLGIRLGFNHHAPEQAFLLAFHQQATDEVGGDQLGGASEEGLGEGWEALGGRGGYGSGLYWVD